MEDARRKKRQYRDPGGPRSKHLDFGHVKVQQSDSTHSYGPMSEVWQVYLRILKKGTFREM
jgi:hypothetical protein